jgi:hypothetical protein
VGLLGIIVAAFKTNPWIALGGVLAAYLLAWADHFLIEKNRSCVYVHPLWSFKGNLRMFGLWFKGRDRAIEIARRTGLPLRIAAKVDPADRDYFEARVLPLLNAGSAIRR